MNSHQRRKERRKVDRLVEVLTCKFDAVRAAGIQLAESMVEVKRSSDLMAQLMADGLTPTGRKSSQPEFQEIPRRKNANPLQ